MASVDWGFRNAGVIHVYGIDYDGVAYLVHEVYWRERTIDWWVEVALELQRAYGVRAWICDSENPEHIYLFRKAGLPAQEANKNVVQGLEVVRTRLHKDRLKFCDDALDEIDAGLAGEKKPVSVTQEIWSYCYPKTLDGREIKEHPAVNCVDHGCDALRYAMMYLDRYDLADARPKPKYPERTYGHYLRDSKAVKLMHIADGPKAVRP
jgi:hypothetical protein